MKTITIKKSYDKAIPENLSDGELAINLVDGIVYYLADDGRTSQILSTSDLKTINGAALDGAGDIHTINHTILNSKAQHSHTHYASDIHFTNERQMVNIQEQSNINIVDISLSMFKDRLMEISDRLDIGSSDEHVKITSVQPTGTTLNNLLGASLSYDDDGVSARSILNVKTSVEELNRLYGIRSNVQSQINDALSIGLLDIIVQNFEDLPPINQTKINRMAIVLSNTEHSNATTMHINNGTHWEYVGVVNGDALRDYNTNPINIINNTKERIKSHRIEKCNASEISLSHRLFVANNIEDALIELYNLCA